MGVAPYKTFTFGGTSSATYGAYITGEGVFNAPERAVEMIDIPGRNGAFALDYGRFNNIEVTYHVGMHDVTDANFAQKVSDFRNFLCSKVGYTRLEDEYNANEYRMAIYKSGLEVEHEGLLNGEFDIVFECKPQRFLTSGETATAVASGGTISNPTLFESDPLLAVKGYGNIAFNGYSITLQNVVLGTVFLHNKESLQINETFSFDGALLNTNDTFSIVPIFTVNYVELSNYNITGCTIDSQTNCEASTTSLGTSMRRNNLNVASGVSLTKGTSSSFTCSATFTMTVKPSGGSAVSTQVTETGTLTYDGDSTFTLQTTVSTPITGTWEHYYVSFGDVYGESTVLALGNPTYIDCDIGECYMIENSEMVSLNSVIDIGSDLPKLLPGTNTINYDNTITELKVTPRWWKV